MSSPAIPVPVHFDGHNINIITEFPNTPTPAKISTSSNKDRQSLYKTELCREWSTSGWCYYGKRCSFAHGLNELRPVFRSKKWRTKRCRNWQGTGYCPYEHRCQFLHDQSPPRRLTDFEGTTVDVEAGDEVESESGDNNGPAGASGKNTEHSAGSTKRRQRQSMAGDAQPNSKDLYFHFEVQAQDDEEDESEAGESENEAGAITVNNSLGRGNQNNGKKRGNNRGAMDNNDILNDIGNTHRVSSGEMDGEYGTAGAADTMFGEDNRKKRRTKRKKGDPVVTPIYFSGDSNNTTAPRRGGKNSTSPTPGGKVAPLDGEPTVNPMQPHIVSGQSATAQLAAQFASMQVSNSTNPQDQAQPSYFPLFGGPANAANTHPPVVSPVAGQSQQHAAALAAAMGILRQQSVTPTPQNNQQGQSPPTNAMNLPPLSSIPMDAATALLSTVYGFPQWPELYHAAQQGQLPQAELQHMTQVMQQYPGTLTAPVPFPATPVANTPAPGGATLVLDSMMGTPSASTEYNIYPTPSPPPSSLGGIDSVSNLGPYQFVPADSPAPFLPAYQPGLGAMPLGLDSTSMAHAATLDPTQFLLSLNHAPFSVPQSTDTPGPMPMFTTTPQPGANTFGNIPPPQGGPLPGLAGAPTSGRGPSPPSQFNNGVPGMYGGFFPTGIAGGMGGPPPPGLSVGNSGAGGAPFASSGDCGDPNIVLFAQNFGSGVINIDGQTHQASS